MLRVLLKWDMILKKRSLLSIMIIYILETYSKDRAIPYCSFIPKLSKFSGKYNQVITEKNIKNV